MNGAQPLRAWRIYTLDTEPPPRGRRHQRACLHLIFDIEQGHDAKTVTFGQLILFARDVRAHRPRRRCFSTIFSRLTVAARCHMTTMDHRKIAHFGRIWARSMRWRPMWSRAKNNACCGCGTAMRSMLTCVSNAQSVGPNCGKWQRRSRHGLLRTGIFDLPSGQSFRSFALVAMEICKR